MKFYLPQNVYDAALDRIRWLYDEFEEVVVSFSGGKDSTTVFNLALQVAREKGRLPLKVLFLDQEAEWQSVVDYVREIGQTPDVQLLWYQIPLKLFNSASSDADWLHCWEPGAEWMRPQEPNAITENRYGTDRFAELFKAISKVDFGDRSTAQLTGVRCEESPDRAVGLTTQATYKHVTWGKILHKDLNHYTFHPIYDWSYTDVWKAIHGNGWRYCPIYDEQYRYGVKLQHMRVSNLHHETSFVSLYYLQEIERDTWNRLCKRLPGINTLGHLKDSAYKCAAELPPMFRDWKEYRDHLLNNLIVHPEQQEKYRVRFAQMESKYRLLPAKDEMCKAQIKAILSNDYHFTQLGNWELRPVIADWRNWMAGKTHKNNATNPYIKMALQQGLTPILPSHANA